MRLRNACSVVFLSVSSAVLCQVAPLPSDRLEPITGFAEQITNQDKRAQALDVIERARWNYNLHADGSEPFKLKVTFTSSGHSLLEGSGAMEETWIASRNWRWSSTFA